MELRAALEAAREPTAGGIGTLGEKTVHAALKRWADENPAHWEVPLPEGFVADVFDGERVTEIQTANFSALRRKLTVLLERYPVTVVHPIVRQKWLCWIDPVTGEVTPPRRSPRRGSWADAGGQLIYLLPCLHHPRLTVTLVLLDVEEHRLADGWGHGGKRGSHRAERYPRTEIPPETLTLRGASDYRALLPAGLPNPFTAAEFGKAVHQQGRTLQGTLKVLLTLEVITREKSGRKFLYRYEQPKNRDSEKRKHKRNTVQATGNRKTENGA